MQFSSFYRVFGAYQTIRTSSQTLGLLYFARFLRIPSISKNWKRKQTHREKQKRKIASPLFPSAKSPNPCKGEKMATQLQSPVEIPSIPPFSPSQMNLLSNGRDFRRRIQQRTEQILLPTPISIKNRRKRPRPLRQWEAAADAGRNPSVSPRRQSDRKTVTSCSLSM